MPHFAIDFSCTPIDFSCASIGFFMRGTLFFIRIHRFFHASRPLPSPASIPTACSARSPSFSVDHRTMHAQKSPSAPSSYQ